jgi:hypothetical protein
MVWSPTVGRPARCGGRGGLSTREARAFRWARRGGRCLTEQRCIDGGGFHLGAVVFVGKGAVSGGHHRSNMLMQLEGKEGVRVRPPFGGRKSVGGAHRVVGVAAVMASNPTSSGGLRWCG